MKLVPGLETDNIDQYNIYKDKRGRLFEKFLRYSPVESVSLQ